MALITLLIRKSHWQPLSQRDVELGKALNSDYLYQLFIMGDTHRMDAGLVQLALQQGCYQPLSQLAMARWAAIVSNTNTAAANSLRAAHWAPAAA
ncbi:hypothetical protein HaLaN_04835 [Haematococcus lacustris]|uniref:Uncharacterized protein n=1 Tax=Haematococcus lacustris TaxID=44745 RepID=A0A699YS86_HAELA|nr:hypothetical protein HaLaN_04835 [Haematococcus lacustris]